jgi:hypothetical protein
VNLIGIKEDKTVINRPHFAISNSYFKRPLVAADEERKSTTAKVINLQINVLNTVPKIQFMYSQKRN